MRVNVIVSCRSFRLLVAGAEALGLTLTEETLETVWLPSKLRREDCWFYLEPSVHIV